MIEAYFEVLGYPFTPYDGSYRWRGQVPSPALMAAVEALPRDGVGFLAMDLETDPVAQDLAAVLTQDRIAALKGSQCRLIRELRAEAYKNEADSLFFGHEADADSSQIWIDKRIEIKARYPWPGSYR